MPLLQPSHNDDEATFPTPLPQTHTWGELFPDWPKSILINPLNCIYKIESQWRVWCELTKIKSLLFTQTSEVLSMTSSQHQSNIFEEIRQLLLRDFNFLCPHSATNSADFLCWLRKKKPFRGRMVSFDVSSLFNNVPLNETVDYIRKALGTHLVLVKSDDPEPLTPQEVCSLILMTVQNIDFQIDGSFFRQVDGVAMAHLAQYSQTFFCHQSKANICFRL